MHQALADVSRVARTIALAAAVTLAPATPAQAAMNCAPLDLRGATLRAGSRSSGDQLTLRGEFALAQGQSIDPVSETVTVSVHDRSGLVFLAALEPGSLTANSTATAWSFSDPSGEVAGGLRRLRLSSADGSHFRWTARALDVDLSDANELELEVVISVGGDCFRAVEPCNRGSKGPSLKCRTFAAETIAAVEVKASGPRSPLPSVIAVGVLGWDPAAPWAMLQPYLPVSHLGQVRVALSPSWLFSRTSTAPPTVQEWQAADASVRTWAREVQRIAAAGFQPTANITGMPRWLSSRPGDESRHPNGEWLIAWEYSPPAQLADWRAMVQRFVSIVASEGVHLIYQVWDEPDWMFFGTLDEYYDLYEVTAQAIRDADPLARVGGPGLSNFGKGKDIGWSSPQGAAVGTPRFLPAWIAEMGRRGAPIDFVDWHFPTPDPNDGQIDRMVAVVRGWLLQAGYDPSAVALRIGEWLKDNCGQEAADLPSAAEIVPMLGRLADAGFAWHTHTSFTDQSGWSDGCWTHVGLLCGAEQHPHFVVRSKLNVFRLVSWLGDTQLPVARRDPFVEAVATSSSDGYEILLANFVSVEGSARLFRRAGEELAATGMLPEAAFAAAEACLVATVATKVVPPPGTLLSCLEAALTPEQLDLVTARAAELRAEALARQTSEWSGVVRITGLRSGVYDVERGVVDRGHANVCAYNKATEPTPSQDACGAGGAVDRQWAAVVETAEEASRAVLRSRGYSQAEIDTIETDLVAPCRATATSQSEFIACVQAGVPALAAQLGRDPDAMTADLLAALAAYTSSLETGETAAAAALNALPEVSARLEAAGQAIAVAQRLDLDMTLPPNATMLVRLSHTQ